MQQHSAFPPRPIHHSSLDRYTGQTLGGRERKGWGGVKPQKNKLKTHSEANYPNKRFSLLFASSSSTQLCEESLAYGGVAVESKDHGANQEEEEEEEERKHTGGKSQNICYHKW